MNRSDWWVGPLAALLSLMWLLALCMKAAANLTGEFFLLSKPWMAGALPTPTLVLGFALFAFFTAIFGALFYWLHRIFFSPTASKALARHALADLEEKPARKKAEMILADALPNVDFAELATDILIRFVGIYGRAYLYAQYEDSEIIFAVSRSGKTRSIVSRRIIEAPGAVVATSTKTDGIALTWKARKALRGSNTLVFDLLATSFGPTPVRWNPILGCEDVNVARERANALAKAQASSRGGGENHQWFTDRAVQILTYFFHAAAISHQDIRAVHRWVSRPGEAIEILKGVGSETALIMASALQDLMVDMADVTASGFKGTMQGALEPLTNPSVLDALTPQPAYSFRAEDFLATSDVLWVLSPESDGSTAAINTMFTDYIYQTARRMSAFKAGGRLHPAVSFILDEAANVAPLPALASMYSEGAGRGIFICAVFQDYAQLEARWGKEEAKTIFQQARIFYALGGSKDLEWNRRIADLSAEYEERRESVSYSTTRGGVSVSTHTERRHELRPGDIAKIPVGKAVLLAAGHDATIIDLSDIKHDPRWGTLADEASREYSARLENLAHASQAPHTLHHFRTVHSDWINHQ